MSRLERIEQRERADQVEYWRSLDTPVSQQLPRRGRIKHLIECFGIGVLISTVFRGIF
jgi:hypothetical protein